MRNASRADFVTPRADRLQKQLCAEREVRVSPPRWPPDFHFLTDRPHLGGRKLLLLCIQPHTAQGLGLRTWLGVLTFKKEKKVISSENVGFGKTGS